MPAALVVVRSISYLVEQVLVSDFSPVSAPHAGMTAWLPLLCGVRPSCCGAWLFARSSMVVRRSFSTARQQALAWGVFRSFVRVATTGAAGCGNNFGYDLEGSSDPELPMVSSDYTDTSAPSAAALASRASVVAAPMLQLLHAMLIMLIWGLLPCRRFLSFVVRCDGVGGAHRAPCSRDGCARARARGRGRAAGAELG